MEASELRIGSIIFETQLEYIHQTDSFEYNDDDRMVVKVTLDHLKLIYYGTEGFQHDAGYKYDPIPINKEWLLKFGFQVKKIAGCDDDYFYSAANFELGWDESGLDLIYEGSTMSLALDHVKYIHQLQNLILSLTGSELELQTDCSLND